MSDGAFRAEVRAWLDEHLVGDFAALRGKGGPGSEHEAFEERRAWDQHLAAHGWTCIGWPEEYGGRGLSLAQQVIFHEEYARANAPARVNHLGEELLGPTLIAFGTERAEGSGSCRTDPGGRGAVVPGLLRARRRLRPRRRSRPRRGCDGRPSGSSTGRRCGPRWPTWPTGAS